jgi:BirA family biotin operon repressor/biotin-[acetyl-CoA-carboxylase] ligase
MNHFPRRDWFGLATFEPGPVFKAGKLFLLEQVGSTSDFLLGRGDEATGRLCRWDGWGWQAEAIQDLQPVQKPLPGQICVARRQSRGRGRQGRSWLDAGGLHLSWVVRADRTHLAWGMAVWTGLITALALRDKFGLPVELKWPNDLLANGRKLGGLLLEPVGGGPKPVVVIGLGLNLTFTTATMPAALRSRATSIQAESGRILVPAAVAGAVMTRFGSELVRFQSEGWSSFREPLARLDWLKGQQVELASGDRRWRGKAVGIDDTGALLVKTAPNFVQRIVAADVHVKSVSGRQLDRGHVKDSAHKHR